MQEDEHKAATVANLRDFIVLVDKTISEIIPTEILKKRAVAERRWQIFLAVMLIDIGGSIANLAEHEDARGMTILVRSMFEYKVKSEYFLKHRQQAFDQYASIPARSYAELSRLKPSGPQISAMLTADFLAWKRTAGSLTEYSGNAQFTTMYMDVTKTSEKLVDKNGRDYTNEFATAYGIPSLYAHGEAPLMPEVFPAWKNDTDWTIRKKHAYIDSITMVQAAATILATFLRDVRKHYGLSLRPVQDLMSVAINLNPSLTLISKPPPSGSPRL